MTSFYGFLMSLFFCGVFERFSGFSSLRDSLSLHSSNQSPSSSSFSFSSDVLPFSSSLKTSSESSESGVKGRVVPLPLPSSLPSFSGVRTPETVPPASLVHSIPAEKHVSKEIASTLEWGSSSSSSQISSASRESPHRRTFLTSTENLSSVFFDSFSRSSQESFLSSFSSSTDFNTPSPSSFSSSLFAFLISPVIFFPFEILSRLFSSLLPQSISSFLSQSKSFFVFSSFHDDLLLPSSSSLPSASRSTTRAPPLVTSSVQDLPVSLRSSSLLMLPPSILSLDAMMKTAKEEEKNRLDSLALSGVSQGNDQRSSSLLLSFSKTTSASDACRGSCPFSSFSSLSFSSSFVSSVFSSFFYSTPLGCLLLVSVGGSISQLCGILCMKITSAVYVSILTTVRRVLLVLVSIVFVQEGEEEVSLPLLARASVVSISLAGVRRTRKILSSRRCSSHSTLSLMLNREERKKAARRR